MGEAERLSALLESLRGSGDAPARPAAPFGGLAGELVFSFLAWEAGNRRASEAAANLVDAVVDINDLRVCLPGEMRLMFGPRYPLALERARRLRAALDAILVRDNCLSMASLARLPGPDASQLLLQICGQSPFVASRVALLGLGAPALPIDGRIARALRRHGALPADVRNDDAGQWAQERLGGADLADTYLRLDRWVDGSGDEGTAG